MLDKCANPSCNESFRSLQGGELFRLETEVCRGPCEIENPEYFWLCPKCSGEISLRLGDGAKVDAILIRGNHRRQNSDQMQFITLDRKEGMLLKSVQSFSLSTMDASNKPRRRGYYD